MAKIVDINTEIETVDRKQMIAASVASVLGWSLDLFDLFILLYVAPVVGTLFFPSDSQTLSLASVYASFAVTLLMRPVGSGIFGSYADRIGRKRAMIVAVVGVGISTALLGALPTIHQVGILAPILFLIIRLIQGVFVGGVVASTHTIGTETVPPKWRGFMSGIVGGGGAGYGALFASLVFFVATLLFPGDAFNTWGWRFMFFSAILSAVLGIFVFSSLQESPFWKKLNSRNKVDQVKQSPVRTIFSRKYRPVLLVNLMVVIGGGSAYYLTSGYLPTFLEVNTQVSSNTSSIIMIFASMVVVFAATLVGYISDFLGRKKTFIIIGIANIILFPILYLSLADATSTSSVTFYVFALSFLGNAAYAPIMIFLNERYPTEIRSSGTGLSWNMGFAVGGMMPTFVSLFSGSVENIPMTLSIFLVGLFILYLIGGLIIPETKGNFE